MRLAPVLAVLAFVLAAPAAQAFGTINGMGQSAEHEKITRLALRCPDAGAECFGPRTLDVVAGRRGSFGMVGGPDMVPALIAQSSAHCDNGDFLGSVPGYGQTRVDAQAALESCRAWMRTNIDLAARRAGDILDAQGAIRPGQASANCKAYDRSQPSAKCKALEAFGAALHAAQDFYSHTNFTDHRAPGDSGIVNPPGFGAPSTAHWLDWRRPVNFPQDVISGCFTGVPERLFCGGRVRHAALNKDTGEIDLASGRIGEGTTPRGKVRGNFARAVAAARDETRIKWATLKDLLVETYGAERGARIACVLRSDNPVKYCG